MRDAGGGVIVNVSSYAADVGGGGIEAPYAITKGGLNVLTRCVRARGRSVRHPCGHGRLRRHPRHEVHRRPPRDPRQSASPTPLGTYPDADSVAEAIAFVASDRARHITGEILGISAGAYMRS